MIARHGTIAALGTHWMPPPSILKRYRKSLRQIHLDFHTPESVPGFLQDFTVGTLVDTLKRAQVQAVKIFAKCEFGNSYYFTEAGLRHPQLAMDWLREVGTALREADILCFAHYAVIRDPRQAKGHPDWRIVFPHLDKDAPALSGTASKHYLCPNSRYLDDIVLPQVLELADYPIDGIFLDLFYFPGGDAGTCVCDHCRSEFERRMGCPLDMTILLKRADLISTFRARVISERREAIIKAFKAKAPGKVTMYNHAHVTTLTEWDHGGRNRAHADAGVSEAQPGTAMGYMSGEHACRLLRTKGVPFEVLPVRFMSGWGDGALKPLPQMNYENALVAANGGVVSLGDHLPPSGVPEKKVYERIGRSFGFIKEREPFILGTRAVTYAAVLDRADDSYWNRACNGAERMLTDRHIQTDVLDLTTLDQLHNYQVLILPDRSLNSKGATLRQDAYQYRIPKLGKADLEMICNWVAAGGLLIASGNALVSEDSAALAETLIGGTVGDVVAPWGFWHGQGNAVPSHYDGFPLLARAPFRRLDPVTAKPLIGWRMPMMLQNPEDDFCGKRLAGELADTPAATVNTFGKGQVLYFACPIFLDYADTRHPWLDELFWHLCATFFADSPLVVEDDLPSLRTNLRTAPDGTLFIDLIYGHTEENITRFPEAGIAGYQVMRHVQPLRDTAIRLLNVTPKSVTLEPAGQPLPWTSVPDGTRFVVPEIRTYNIVRIVPCNPRESTS